MKITFIKDFDIKSNPDVVYGCAERYVSISVSGALSEYDMKLAFLQKASTQNLKVVNYYKSHKVALSDKNTTTVIHAKQSGNSCNLSGALKYKFSHNTKGLGKSRGNIIVFDNINEADLDIQYIK